MRITTISAKLGRPSSRSRMSRCPRYRYRTRPVAGAVSRSPPGARSGRERSQPASGCRRGVPEMCAHPGRCRDEHDRRALLSPACIIDSRSVERQAPLGCNLFSSHRRQAQRHDQGWSQQTYRRRPCVRLLLQNSVKESVRLRSGRPVRRISTQSP